MKLVIQHDRLENTSLMYLWLLAGKTLAVKFSHDSDTSSSTVAESDKVLIPPDQDITSEELQTPDITSEDPQVPLFFSMWTIFSQLILHACSHLPFFIQQLWFCCHMYLEYL